MRVVGVLILTCATVVNAQPTSPVVPGTTSEAAPPPPSAPITQPGLTEHDAVAAAINRASLRDVLDGTTEVERGRGFTARAYPNPEVSYAREQTFGASGTAETYLSVSQAIDLGRRRHLRGEAGDRRAEATHLEGEGTKLGIAAETRLRFYEVLYRQQHVAALERWGAHVADALSIVARREKRGDAAAYERKRLEREQTLASGRLATEGAELEHARTRLRAIMGAASIPPATGSLLPADDVPALAALRLRGTSRPEFRALDLLVDATLIERKAAARWWVPDLRLELGLKAVSLDAGGRTDGYIAGLSLALPLWDRSRGATAAALGEARVARGRHALLDEELASQLEGIRAEALHLRQVAEAFEKTAQATDLVKLTARGYEAGELTLLELLDAYRGEVEDETTAVEMELAARRARIELDRLTGAPLP